MNFYHFSLLIIQALMYYPILKKDFKEGNWIKFGVGLILFWGISCLVILSAYHD